jgi:hypothetical protein
MMVFMKMKVRISPRKAWRPYWFRTITAWACRFLPAPLLRVVFRSVREINDMLSK